VSSVVSTLGKSLKVALGSLVGERGNELRPDSQVLYSSDCLEGEGYTDDHLYKALKGSLVGPGWPSATLAGRGFEDEVGIGPNLRRRHSTHRLRLSHGRWSLA
jgi:hypothetical protein